MYTVQFITFLIGISPAACAMFFRGRPSLRSAATIWALLFCFFYFFAVTIAGPRLVVQAWIKSNGGVAPPEGFLEGVTAAFELIAPIGLYLFLSAVVLAAVPIRSRSAEPDLSSKSGEA